MELLYIKTETVQQVFDTGTSFSAAKFVFTALITNIWKMFVIVRVNILIGYSSCFFGDQS